MADPRHTLDLPCPAKLNLALAVGPPDPRGYHPIASLMCLIAFGDTLRVERLEEGASRFDIAFAPDAPRPHPIDWAIEKDLVYRAHVLLQREAGRPLPVAATLAKRVPAGAGLGGGSSDAASMLVAIDRLFDLHLGESRLIELSRELGSDIAFFVAAHFDASRAAGLVTGYGERVEPARAPNLDIVLVLPPLACPTGAVYAAFDRRPRGPFDAERVRRMASQGRVAPDEPFNDLAEPACDVTPELRVVRQCIADATGRPVHITGSGAAMFLIAQNSNDAAELAARIRALNLAAIATHTTTSIAT